MIANRIMFIPSFIKIGQLIEKFYVRDGRVKGITDEIIGLSLSFRMRCGKWLKSISFVQNYLDVMCLAMTG
jgi:hypothetical protein